jgi:tetratricopeptide (TPR) repeat protein
MQEGHDAYREAKYDQALSRFQEALKLTKSLDPKIAGNVLVFTTDDALAQIGNCYLQLHQLESAQSSFTALMEWRKQNLQYDSSVAVAFENLAVVDTMKNDFAKAGNHLKQGIAYIDDCINHFKSSDTYSPQDIVANDDRRLKSRLNLELANVYANLGKYDDALTAYEEAFQIANKFRAPPKAQTQIVSTAITVARLANRTDKLEMWEERNKTLEGKKE